MRFQVYTSLTLFGRRWFWRLRARNGEIIAQGESYRRRVDAVHAVGLVRATSTATPIEELP